MNNRISKQYFFRRVIAYLVDVIILFFVLSILGLIFRSIFNIVPNQGFQVWLSILINFSIPGWFYFVLSEFLPTSATLGKRMMNLIAIDEKGERLSLWQSVLRSILKLLPIEVLYFAAFGLYTLQGTFVWLQIFLMAFALICVTAYLVVAFRSNGLHSLYDLIVKSQVVFKGLSPSDFEDVFGDI